MKKREKGHCGDCGREEGEENLSNQKLCYLCAKGNMVRTFNVNWLLKHKSCD